MIIGWHRNGGPITECNPSMTGPKGPAGPEALLVFKHYGKPLKSGLVRLARPGGPALLFNPDTGSVWREEDDGDKALTAATEKANQIKSAPRERFVPTPGKRHTGSVCTVLGTPATTENSIITDEGHVYTKEGLLMLFSGGRRVARSPYPGAKPLLKSKYFSRE